MTASWSTSVTPVGPPRTANPRLRFLIYAATVTGIWSGLLCLLVFAIGHLARVSFVVEQPDGQMAPIQWFAVLLMPLGIALIAALLASLMRGRTRAGRIVFWLGTVIAIASVYGPLAQPIGWSSRILLLLMHAITWVLVVPQLARIVGDSEPGASVDRSE
jgi:hypothetical protein